MSRLARQPIEIPEGVTVKEDDGLFSIKGPKGEITVDALIRVKASVGPEGIAVSPEGEAKESLANTGTTWALLRNAIQGVTEGFSKILEIEGVGYRATLEGTTLVLALGFSKPIRYDIPEGLEVVVEKSTITISGVSKEQVGQIAAEIRAFRKPEPYKGKGIRYRGEVIRRKVGKKAATAAS